MEKHNLTERQRRFCHYVIELGNASEAAERAGFKRTYAQGAKRQPAVKAYLEECRKRMPAQSTEVINFLTGVMRGNIKASQMRSDAAVQIGIRAGLWKSEAEANKKIKEAMKHE